MRRRIAGAISGGWWAVLGAVGLPPERWRALPQLTRRAVKGAIWVAIGLVLVALFGVWKTSALAVAVVVLLLVVPKYEHLTIRGVRVGKRILPVAVLALAIAYPYYLGSMPEVPIFGPFPAMSTMVVMMIFTMMALGLNFVVGYAGLLDLGYVAFYAMGAYMAGWFASSQFANRNVNLGAVGLYPGATGLHFSIWLVLPMAGIATAIVGVLIGLPTLRLRGDYLAIVTLGFGEIMPQIARNGNNLFGFNLTNGTGGITPIDGPGFGNWLDQHLYLPGNYLNAANFDNLFFWTSLVLVLLTIFTSARLRDSRLGRAWVAIREDEVAAAAMGVPLMRTKTWAYATG
ncbi:MAG: branched-chain amino acid ABC transporter permease, partial [Gaiellaceae bacterium]